MRQRREQPHPAPRFPLSPLCRWWYNIATMRGADEILFGSDPTPGVVAVEVMGDVVRLYRRVDDKVITQTRPLRRWMLTTEKHPFDDARWIELEGDGFRWLAEFADRDAYESARYFIRDAHAESISYPSAVRQYLIRSGMTLFKGMSFDDPVRMQIDIETLGLNPESARNAILIVAVSDNRGLETIIEGDEPSILRELVALVRERDPDIIEGHNIYGFDLPYLACRAKLHGIRLALGRDGSEIAFGSQLNCMIGYFARPYTPVHIEGRHVIDTMLAVQRFDVGRGELTSHSLKSVAQAFGIAEDDREIIPHNRIAHEWKHNPDRVRKYALQDVRETRSLAGLVCPSEFYLTQMVPDTYWRAATSGTGEKINYIFIREYLRRGHAIPRQSPPKPLPGGYTEVRTTGVIGPIVKCDVESLYPSLMLARRIKPKSDTLDIFLPALEELTRRRFEAKKCARETGDTYWEGLQSSFKILINSFYGYLGGPFNFNDYDAAAQVTTGGQEIVKQIVRELEQTGSRVIEIDTDGVYFQPPPGIETEEAEIEYVEHIGEKLPEGIRLAHDGRYRAMISLKMKNYILEKYSGEKIFKGSAMRSRADEAFGLDFIAKAADCLLRGEPAQAAELYRSIARRIESGEMKVEEFARRERVTEKTYTSSGKKRLARAAGESKVGDYITIYQRADGSIALARDYDSDEDREYLLDKLYKFALRLKEAFGDDFDTLFPRPTPRTRIEAAGQQTLGLFD